MSFFGYRGSSSSKPPQETHQSELERLRGRQLASLVRAGGRAKNQQQTTFDVAIAETTRGPLVLHITLQSEFPIKAPQVQTSMPLQHPWLDATGNVQGHQDLNHWTAHSDLGRIVSEIVNELRRVAATAQVNYAATPPPAPVLSPSRQSQTSPYQQQPSTHKYPLSPNRQSTQLQPQQPSVDTLQRTQMPVIPAIFPDLEELSFSQLETLTNDRHALKAFVKKLDIVQEFMKLREEVMNGNMHIAEKTLSYEAKMRDLQNEVQILRQSLRASQEALAQKQVQQQRIAARNRPDALLDQLAAATKELDTATDDMAHEFTNGSMDVTQFIAQYLPQRNLYHERSIKLAKTMQP